MLTMGYRLIPISKVLGLSTNEMYTYFCIVAKSDYELHTSHIKLDTLSALTGIKKTETLSRHITELESRGLLIKQQTKECGDKGYFNLNTYHLYHPAKDWVRIDLGLLDMDIAPKLKAFLVLLKCLCVNNTNYIGYDKTQIANLLNMSRGTVIKHLKECSNLKLVMEQDNGFLITDTAIFKIDPIKVVNDDYYTNVYYPLLKYLKSINVVAPLYNKKEVRRLSAHFGNTSFIIENLKKCQIPKTIICSWNYIFKVLNIDKTDKSRTMKKDYRLTV